MACRSVIKVVCRSSMKDIFFIVFIRSSSDTRWKCRKNKANSRTKKKTLKYARTECYQS